jgi:uncharacterized phage protein (TIGR02218 family)
MSYDAYELSQELGEPRELYTFTIGQDEYRYTSADEDIVFLAQTYSAVPISRTPFDETQEMARNQITLTVTRDFQICTLFQIAPPSELIILRIYRLHRDDSERVAVWFGRVLNVEKRGIQGSITCENVFTSLRRPGLRLRYSRPCQYALYDPDTCKADKELNRIDLSPSAVGGVIILHIDFASQPDGFYAGGYVEWEYVTGSFERRGIRYHVGNSIYISHPIADLGPGDEISVYAGCDHSMGDCEDIHENLPNHGGHPFIPIVSPFGGKSVF